MLARPNCNKKEILKSVSDIGPKGLLVAAVGYACKALSNAAKEPLTPEDARHAVNMSAVLTTGAGWLDLVTTAMITVDEWRDYGVRTGRYYYNSWRGYTAGALTAGALATGAVAIKKSSIPGEEMTSFALAGASGAMAWSASLFAHKELQALKSNQLRPVEPSAATPLSSDPSAPGEATGTYRSIGNRMGEP